MSDAKQTFNDESSAENLETVKQVAEDQSKSKFVFPSEVLKTI